MESLLLIDDEPRVGDALRFALSRHGYEVTQATSGSAGLAEARTRRPGCILLDIGLRGEDGLDSCRALKADAATRAIPVIVLSGINDAATRARGLGAGADDFVPKPFTAVELRARIEAQMRSRSRG